MILRFAALAAVFCAAALPSPAQTAALIAKDIPRLANGKPDFSGVWDHPRVADVTKDGKTCGSYTPGCEQKGSGDLAFTPEGMAIWKDEEHRFDYSGHCLPWGYTRAWQVEYPGGDFAVSRADGDSLRIQQYFPCGLYRWPAASQRSGTLLDGELHWLV